MQKINFQNLPSTTTPINATNLNAIQDNAETAINLKADMAYIDGTSPMGNVVVDSIRSKNIFSSQLELGTYDSSGNKSSSSANYRNASFVAVQPNTTYTFSINGTSQKYVLLYYTSARAFISQDTSLTTGTFTTPNNCYYINIRCFSADFTNDYANLKIQLEKGTTATSYSPYQELDNQEIYSTNEIKIGTWIDGKDLYRKVLTSSTYSSSYWIPTPNIKELVNIRGMIQRSDYTDIWCPIPSRLDNTSFSSQFGNITTGDTTQVAMILGSSWSSSMNKIVLVLEYTKN